MEKRSLKVDSHESNEEVSASLADTEVEEILEKLEPEEQSLIATMFSGPLPPPEVLAGYAEVYPDAPEKLFCWVEEQQEHRHYMDKEYLKKDFNYKTFGIICGLAVVFAFLLFGFLLILNDKEIIGVGVMVPALTPLVALFVNQKIKNEKGNNKTDKEINNREDDKENESLLGHHSLCFCSFSSSYKHFSHIILSSRITLSST